MAERTYRPALDGLRAVAVGGVILYHLGSAWLPGGFLGVDLFFVLSGYLITGLLLDEHGRRGRIGLPAFYVRRFRRLMPALLLVVLAVAAAVRLLEPPWSWSGRRADLLATLFYYANWHFIATDQSYFAEFTAQSPLRHAWSLAIEEQFYLVWPLLMVVLLRHARRWLPALVAAGAAASAIAMVALYSPAGPTRAYAGTDARAQQLLIGALLAIVALRHRHWAARLGLPALLAGGVLAVTVHDDGRFYYHGGATVVAVVGGVLLCAADQSPASVVSRLLSLPPIAWLGRISYGLYLWHWPVFLFFPHQRTPVRLGAVLALAVASYYLVELPIRRGRPRFALGSPVRVAAAAPVALALSALLVIAGTTFATGSQKTQLTLLRATPALSRACPDNGDYLRVCVRVPAPPGRPTMAVIGDSVARALDPGFVDLAKRRNWGYLLAANSGCGIAGLLLTRNGAPIPEYTRCAEQAPKRVEKLVSENRPDLVVTVARKELQEHVAPDGSVVSPPSPVWADDFHDGLAEFARTVTRSGTRLTMVPIFDMASGTNECLTDPDRPGCTVPAEKRTALADRVYRQVAGEVPQVKLVPMQDLVCPGGSCPVEINGQIVRYDGVHFTEPGAKWFVTHLEPRLMASIGGKDLA